MEVVAVYTWMLMLASLVLVKFIALEVCKAVFSMHVVGKWPFWSVFGMQLAVVCVALVEFEVIELVVAPLAL